MSKAIGDLGLDTNAAIACLQGHPRAMSWVEAADALFLPVVCYGELRYGALHSKKATENAVLSEDAHFDRIPGLTRYDWNQPLE